MLDRTSEKIPQVSLVPVELQIVSKVLQFQDRRAPYDFLAASVWLLGVELCSAHFLRGTLEILLVVLDTALL